MVAKTIQWAPPIAKCAMCQCTVQQKDIVYGHQHPLAPNDHYCPKCAEVLHVVDQYSVNDPRIRSIND